MVTYPGSYDLLVILAGDKAARHPAALELLRREWASWVTVTGEHEHVDPRLAPAGRLLRSPASRSTREDAMSARALVERHRFTTVLVVTSAFQVERARLAFRRVFDGCDVTIDILSWEGMSTVTAEKHPALRAVRRHALEVVKLTYYVLRRHA